MGSWENYKPKWFKVSLKVKSPEQFSDILKWLETNVQGHRKHTVWRLTGNSDFEIRFRFERDYEWFVLRWQ